MPEPMQYWERKCGCHTPNMMACGACDKCLDHCECSKGNIELFEALARNKLERARRAMVEGITNVPRKKRKRKGGPTVPDASKPGRTGPKKKFCMG